MRREVLIDDLNDWKERECHVIRGSWFQVDEPWYEKECCPTDLVRNDCILKNKKRRVS